MPDPNDWVTVDPNSPHNVDDWVTVSPLQDSKITSTSANAFSNPASKMYGGPSTELQSSITKRYDPLMQASHEPSAYEKFGAKMGSNENLPMMAALGSSLLVPGSGTLVSEGVPALAAMFTKGGVNAAENKPIDEGVLKEGAWQVGGSLVGKGLSKAFGAASKALKSRAGVVKAVESGDLTKLDPTSAAKVSEAEAALAKSSAEGTQAVESAKGTFAKSIASKGKSSTPTELGTQLGNLAKKAKDVTSKVSSDRFKTAFGKVPNVDLSDFKADIAKINPEDLANPEAQTLVKAVRGAGDEASALGVNISQYPKHVQEQYAKALGTPENPLADVPFEIAHDLRSAIGRKTLGASTPKVGAAKQKFGDIAEFLDSHATESGVGPEYKKAVDAYRYFKNLTRPARSIGGQVEKQGLGLDPQKAIDTASGSTKRIEEFKKLVALLKDPEATKYIKPEELAKADSTVKSLSRQYLNDLSAGGDATKFLANISKHGEDSIKAMLSVSYKSKGAVTAAYNNLVKLANEVQLAESTLKSNTEVGQKGVKQAVKGAKVAGKEIVKQSNAYSEAAITTSAAAASLGILSTSLFGHGYGAPTMLGMASAGTWAIRSALKNVFKGILSHPERLETLGSHLDKARNLSTKIPTGFRAGSILLDATQYYTNSPDFEFDKAKLDRIQELFNKHSTSPLSRDEVSELQQLRSEHN